MNKLLQSRKELDEEMKKIKTNSESSSVNNQSLKTEDSKNKIEILPVKVNKFGINIEKDEAKDTPKNNSSLAIGERIKELEDKKTKLQREIAEKEKTIRQKILKCIFNNYKEISGELGDDIFLNSVTDDKKLTVEKIKELIQVYSIEQLRKDYANQLEKETSIFDKHNQQLDQAENENESIKKSLLEVNPYEYDKFIASLYHFQPQDSFFKNNPNVRQNAFDNLGLKGIGKYDEVKELQRMLEKYNLNNNRGNQPSNKGVTYNNPGRIYGQYGSDNTQDGVSYNFGSDNNQKNEKDKLIQHLENSNELGDFTNLTYNHKERANEINKGLFSNFSNSIWVNIQEVQEAYQRAQIGSSEFEKAQIQIPPK
ncbi:21210_t:CDS:2 [Racocetra persica]|uniref:21210_t:CDS:1 n=1 Tax=Racocetra persica TaxID=160502 RepID=A0ACA9P456_9GLOM|nr:21210_t:CDS:2 [Racocetra persica]